MMVAACVRSHIGSVCMSEHLVVTPAELRQPGCVEIGSSCRRCSSGVYNVTPVSTTKFHGQHKPHATTRANAGALNSIENQFGKELRTYPRYRIGSQREKHVEEKHAACNETRLELRLMNHTTAQTRITYHSIVA
jgi:hypothetical protein